MASEQQKEISIEFQGDMNAFGGEGDAHPKNNNNTPCANVSIIVIILCNLSQLSIF